jgi:hypothetical protein
MIKTVWHRKEVVKCVLFVLVVDVIWGFAVASVVWWLYVYGYSVMYLGYISL